MHSRSGYSLRLYFIIYEENWNAEVSYQLILQTQLFLYLKYEVRRLW
jgi:hypothetical protein